MLSLKFYFN